VGPRNATYPTHRLPIQPYRVDGRLPQERVSATHAKLGIARPSTSPCRRGAQGFVDVPLIRPEEASVFPRNPLVASQYGFAVLAVAIVTDLCFALAPI